MTELDIPTKSDAHRAYHHRRNDQCAGGGGCPFYLVWDRGNYELLADLAVYIQENPHCLVKKDYRAKKGDRWRQAPKKGKRK